MHGKKLTFAQRNLVNRYNAENNTHIDTCDVLICKYIETSDAITMHLISKSDGSKTKIELRV